MAGVYVHIPFCKTRCIYCDFFTRTDMGQKNPYINALCREIVLRKDYLEKEPIDTIYLGGGTPSQLSQTDLKAILDTIKSQFTINKGAEITIEANPDDLSDEYLAMLIELGFNRLSMGIQSFDDKLLQFLNRRHSSEKAIGAVKSAQKIGFTNISIDLMYGLPQQTMDIWQKTLDIAINLNVQHISSYHLIYEQGTKLYRLLNKGEVKPVEEDLSLDMFSVMIDRLNDAGFVHYEISNFGKEDCFSRHNSSYWLGTKYLGLGPAAHSYNKINRAWNISSIPKYISGINEGIPCLEEEILSIKDQYNDFILTGMRTMWGVTSTDLENRFGTTLLQYFLKNIKKHIEAGSVTQNECNYKLNKKGIFISDSIMSDLMYID